MIKILKAATKEALIDEWHLLDIAHYGRRVDWNEKKFRFKAVDNGKLVGTIDGKYESGIVYIGALITAKSARGRGIGKNLIKRAEEFGRKLGAHRSWLITGKWWAANTFYNKLGFVQIGVLPDFHFHKDFVIYTRQII